MVTMRLGSFHVTHVYGHNSVPHTEEVNKPCRMPGPPTRDKTRRQRGS